MRQEMKTRMYGFSKSPQPHKKKKEEHPYRNALILGGITCGFAILAHAGKKVVDWCVGNTGKQKHKFRMEEAMYRDSSNTACNNTENESTSAVVSEACSYSQMMNTLQYKYGDWICPTYIPKGMISGIVSGANLGKTILITQIALDAAKGNKSSLLSDSSRACSKVEVLHYCFEPRSTDKGYFPERIFPSNYKFISREQLEKSNSFSPKGLLEDLRKRVEDDLVNADTLVVIDPVTKLPKFRAQPFVGELQKITSEASSLKGVSLTILISAHMEEKERWKPVTSCEIAGGDGLARFLDFVITIRESKESSERFIQILKSKCEYDHDKVSVVRFDKTEEGQTYFKFVKESTIKEALPSKPQKRKTTDSIGEQKKTIADVYEDRKRGMRPRDIVLKYRISSSTMYRWIKKYEEELKENK